MTYHGPERRRHRVYITRNTEYHIRDNRCVAVRDPRTGEWKSDHDALGKEIAGGLAIGQSGSLSVHLGEPKIGDQIFFTNDLATTVVTAINRPSLATVAQYAHAA